MGCVMQDIRRQAIKELLLDRGSIMIAELTERLGVSEMTVHRDLDVLQDEGFLTKKRGGAVLNEGQSAPDSGYRYDYVKSLYVKEKQAIAKTAVSLLGEGETLIFDNSTTACEVAKLLKHDHNMTVVATNPGVFNELSNSTGITLYSSGGLYSMQTNSLVGSAAEDFVNRIRITTAIISAGCVSAEQGATESYPSEAALKRKMIRKADRTLLLTVHNKLGSVGTERIAEWKDIGCLITDSKADENELSEIRKQTKVIVCDV